MYKKEIDNFVKRYMDKDLELEIEKIDYPDLIDGDTCYFHVHFKIPKTKFFITSQGHIKHKNIEFCDELYGFYLVENIEDHHFEEGFLISIANRDFEKFIKNFDKHIENIIMRMKKIKELKKQLSELTSFSFKNSKD